jgi:hypothetical protein
MRNCFNLPKIVHAFDRPEAVLFEFISSADAQMDVPFATPYIMKGFNQLREAASADGPKEGPEIDHQFA